MAAKAIQMEQLQQVLQAQIEAEQQIDSTLKKVKFFDYFKTQLNKRQLIAVKRMFEEGLQGFKGGMNARKYISLTKTSKATATRDLQLMAHMGVFVASGGGRSTSYQLNIA